MKKSSPVHSSPVTAISQLIQPTEQRFNGPKLAPITGLQEHRSPMFPHSSSLVNDVPSMSAASNGSVTHSAPSQSAHGSDKAT
jgi:hypothetical protein